MNSPSMPCGNNPFSIPTFTTMMLSKDQIILYIGFHLIVYSSIACAQEIASRGIGSIRRIRCKLMDWIDVDPVKIGWTQMKLSFLSLREVHAKGGPDNLIQH